MTIKTTFFHWSSDLMRIFSLIVKLKSDDGQRLVLTIDAHEIEERFGRLQRCLGNERCFLAAFENGASHILINHEFDLRQVLDFTAHIDLLIANALDKVSLLWVTTERTPKLL